jgi:hydrogenase-4 component B
MMSPEKAVFDAILVCVAGAALTLPVSRNKTAAGWLAFLATLVAGALAGWAAIRVLGWGHQEPVTFLSFPRLGFALRLYVDGLSALFLLLVMAVALPAAFYSIAFMPRYADYGVSRYYPNFLLFIASMLGLVSTTDTMYFFFIFWQMMTLSSFVLVQFEHRRVECRRAANRYFWMMQIACALTLIGAGLLASRPPAPADGALVLRYDFDSISRQLPSLLQTHPLRVTVALALLLIGFGIKAGMWPFGVLWLPGADAAAPPSVGSLLSGVTIKMGIYGIIRFLVWLVPPEAVTGYSRESWGFLLAACGTVTLFTGTLQALKQEDSLRLLAYHSIGQCGYILLGLGACLSLMSADPGQTLSRGLAAFGLFGALFHSFNHALFKGLLFLNAGSIWYATGIRDLNRLGGLMKHMPLTALTALVAAFSISGVPLFNGFASKWSLCVATIEGGAFARHLPVCALVAILTSALTLASFIKFFGAAFLSRASREVTDRADRRPSLEVDGRMIVPQLFLAGGCLFLGLFPGLAYRVIGTALDASRQGLGSLLADAVPAANGSWTTLTGFGQGAVFAPIALVLLFGLMLGLSWGLTKLGGATRRTVPTWQCGYARETDLNRYGAHHFYREFKRYFHWVGGTPPPDHPEQSGARPTPGSNQTAPGTPS